MAPVATWPKFITASRWPTAWTATWNAAKAKHGTAQAPSGALAARITNAEAITLIQAWSEAAGPAAFPLWYQFAAIAYGWDTKRDKLNTSRAQANAMYPLDAADELWFATSNIADQLDRAAPTSPRLNLDGRFDDVVYQATVRLALTQDGAQANWVIGFGGCKDENGKPGKPRKNPKTGKWECDPVIIEDPKTTAGKKAGSLFSALLILGALYVVLKGDGN